MSRPNSVVSIISGFKSVNGFCVLRFTPPEAVIVLAGLILLKGTSLPTVAAEALTLAKLIFEVTQPFEKL